MHVPDSIRRWKKIEPTSTVDVHEHSSMASWLQVLLPVSAVCNLLATSMDPHWRAYYWSALNILHKCSAYPRYAMHPTVPSVMYCSPGRTPNNILYGNMHNNTTHFVPCCPVQLDFNCWPLSILHTVSACLKWPSRITHFCQIQSWARIQIYTSNCTRLYSSDLVNSILACCCIWVCHVHPKYTARYIEDIFNNTPVDSLKDAFNGTKCATTNLHDYMLQSNDSGCSHVHTTVCSDAQHGVTLRVYSGAPSKGYPSLPMMLYT
jgi:hypothetical protein